VHTRRSLIPRAEMALLRTSASPAGIRAPVLRARRRRFPSSIWSSRSSSRSCRWRRDARRGVLSSPHAGPGRRRGQATVSVSVRRRCSRYRRHRRRRARSSGHGAPSAEGPHLTQEITPLTSAPPHGRLAPGAAGHHRRGSPRQSGRAVVVTVIAGLGGTGMDAGTGVVQSPGLAGGGCQPLPHPGKRPVGVRRSGRAVASPRHVAVQSRRAWCSLGTAVLSGAPTGPPSPTR
jgi:hypothetical protein